MAEYYFVGLISPILIFIAISGYLVNGTFPQVRLSSLLPFVLGFIIFWVLKGKLPKPSWQKLFEYQQRFIK